MDSSPVNHGNMASLSVVGRRVPNLLLMTWIVRCSQGSGTLRKNVIYSRILYAKFFVCRVSQKLEHPQCESAAKNANEHN
jgi:hypothetical protein